MSIKQLIVAHDITRQRPSVRKYKLWSLSLLAAVSLKVVVRVTGILAVVEELLGEEPIKEEEDTLEELLSLFCVHVLYISERRKAMRIEGYPETVVPRYNLSISQSFSSFFGNL